MKTPDPSDGLFGAISQPPKQTHFWLVVQLSIVTHVLVGLALVIVPLYFPEPLPAQGDVIRLLIYNPPPPPPPPPPRGALPQEVRAVQPTPQIQPERPAFTTPPDVLEPPTLTERPGEADGSDLGVAEGMEGGVEGGVVGGVLGGVVGGVVGGTGDGPIQDYDQPPRPIKITRPLYPQEAFVKKVEGTVLVEILIDASGRVVSARVIKSVPLLDAAALQTVKQWLFTPAIKRGRPVSTIAHAPVGFRIY
jgi:periplasmic protein TonB